MHPTAPADCPVTSLIANRPVSLFVIHLGRTHPGGVRCLAALMAFMCCGDHRRPQRRGVVWAEAEEKRLQRAAPPGRGPAGRAAAPAAGGTPWTAAHARKRGSLGTPPRSLPARNPAAPARKSSAAAPSSATRTPHLHRSTLLTHRTHNRGTVGNSPRSRATRASSTNRWQLTGSLQQTTISASIDVRQVGSGRGADAAAATLLYRLGGLA